MPRFQKVYLEISDLCNLQCSFCPGTRRPAGMLTQEQMAVILPKLRPYSDYLYFHVLGEPLLHPDLGTFLEMAHAEGFRVIITTNGTLLPQKQEILLRAPALHKVNISLQSHEANAIGMTLAEYLAGCIGYAQACSGNKLTVFRLWNEGGLSSSNAAILQALHAAFPGEWLRKARGTRMADNVFLEYGKTFSWPDLRKEAFDGRFYCYGLRDQLGVLCDGTVVPCCLDHDGDIPLGSLLEQDMDTILASPRARALYEGFSCGKASEELCRRCGYARRFVE